MNSQSMNSAFPEKFTLSLDRDTFVNIHLNHSGVSTIEEFLGNGQGSNKTELDTETLLAFIEDFVVEKIQQGYMMLEEVPENSENNKVKLSNFSFEEEEEKYGSQMRNKNLDEKEKNVELEEEKFEDYLAIEKFECPFELNPLVWDMIKVEVDTLNLKFETLDGSILQVSGKQSDISNFSKWFNEFLCCVLVGENKVGELIEKKSEKIAYSMVYDAEIENIIMRASALEIECIFLDNHLNVKGAPSDLETFKVFLNELDLLAKKYLFPKYWDFSIIEPYAEVKVDSTSQEFKEILRIFSHGFENAQISRLTRIQNYDLWNNYISTICSRTEVDPQKNLQRKLLFHGTRFNKPYSIFKESDIGFDLKHANGSSRYGKGIYFATNSFYSHSYAHNSGTGTFQMLIADVYTGLPFHKTRHCIFSQLTDEQDSLFSEEDNFFVLYKNSQSYPLYLVDYTLKDNYGTLRYVRQKHVTNIMSGGYYCLVENSNPRNLYRELFKMPQTDQQPDILCIRRIQKEFLEAERDEFIRENFHFEKVDRAGCIEWIVSFIGFQDTPYEGGLFKLKVIFPATYPLKPPFVQFLTKIYHPSIDDEGMVCLGLLSSWSPTSEIRHVLLSISCLLHDPEIEDPLMADTLYFKDRREYMKTARSWTRKYAGL